MATQSEQVAAAPLVGGGSTTLHSHAGSEAFPIGAVFIAVVSTNPNTLLGYGTWSQIAGGRVLVGQTSGDADFDTAEETGGAKTHVLTLAEIPAHGHTQQVMSSASGSSSGVVRDVSSSMPVNDARDTASAGGGGAHNNMPPYLVVYIWKRTA